jgi:hypothetical protein
VREYVCNCLEDEKVGSEDEEDMGLEKSLCMLNVAL